MAANEQLGVVVDGCWAGGLRHALLRQVVHATEIQIAHVHLQQRVQVKRVHAVQ